MGTRTNSNGKVAACVWAVVLASASVGCSIVKSERTDIVYQIDAVNRSSRDIRFVVIDPDGAKNQFGFLASGGSGTTSSFCRFRFSGAFAVAWEEDTVTRKVAVDILKYEKKKGQIKSFGFCYLGNGKWHVIARSGTEDDSPEVKP